MRNKTVLVTGGSGFIGSHLVNTIIKSNNNVIVIDSLISSTTEFIDPYIQSGKCRFIKGDIRDQQVLNSLTPPIDFIFHLAADPDVKTSVDFPLNSFEHNVRGTLNILEIARRLDVQGFFFASSGGTLYGDVEEFPIKENTVLSPISPYGASKAACEMYATAYANTYQFKIVAGRFANIIGERSFHGICYDFYNKLIRNPGELTILGDGLQKKSYLHISDCIDAIMALSDNLDKQEVWYDYFNIGSDEWVSVKQIAEIVENEMNLFDVHHKFTGGKKGWVGDVHKIFLSNKKIKKITGWSPNLTTKKAITLTISWLKSREPE